MLRRSLEQLFLKFHLGSKAQSRLLARSKHMSRSTIPFDSLRKDLKIQKFTHILDRVTEIGHFGSKTGSNDRYDTAQEN